MTYTRVIDGETYRLVYLDYSAPWYRHRTAADDGRPAELGVRLDHADRDEMRWEFLIEGHNHNGVRRTALRLGDDAYDAFRETPELFEMLADAAPATLAAVRALLDDLGAVDVTPRTDSADRAPLDPWTPAVQHAPELLADLVYKSTITLGAHQIYSYEHCGTGRYLNLDASGQAWWIATSADGDTVARPWDLREAVAFVREEADR
ncbi:hypothetical protein [Nocardia wallacei]|uniref:hypothetical protein n=1 Tax=Nocardia wallacei TaxID=480035 RepID=UPI002456C1D0|nr:hypothetical protein [Nocardia wallacei]